MRSIIDEKLSTLEDELIRITKLMCKVRVDSPEWDRLTELYKLQCVKIYTHNSWFRVMTDDRNERFYNRRQ